MTSVPEYGRLQSVFLPVAFSNACITSGGKPCGYVGSGLGESRPASSQWPMVVSFPFDDSVRRANEPCGSAAAGRQETPSMLNRPSFRRFGTAQQALAQTEASVSLPASPKSAASGASPTPRLSRTIKKMRLTGCMEIPPCGANLIGIV